MNQALSKLLSRVEDFSGALRDHLDTVGDWIESATELERELLQAYRAIKADVAELLGNDLSVARIEQLLLVSLRRELTPENIRTAAKDVAKTVARLHAETPLAEEGTPAGDVLAPVQQPITERAPADEPPPCDCAGERHPGCAPPPTVSENVEEKAPADVGTGVSSVGE